MPVWLLRRSAPARAPRSRRRQASGAGTASARTRARRSARRARAQRVVPVEPEVLRLPLLSELVQRGGRIPVPGGRKRAPLAVEPVESRFVHAGPRRPRPRRTAPPGREQPGDPVESVPQVADRGAVSERPRPRRSRPRRPRGPRAGRAGRDLPAARAGRSRARRTRRPRAPSSARLDRSPRPARVRAAAEGVSGELEERGG